LAKRTRRKPTGDKQQNSDSSSNWTTTSAEDGGSERVRFDHHVSFIDADEEASNKARSLARRKRSNKEMEEDATTDTQRSLRFLRRLFSR
jgi:E3 ubiquitin-protein ligase RNF19A